MNLIGILKTMQLCANYLYYINILAIIKSCAKISHETTIQKRKYEYQMKAIL